jgi:hypothetical protein
MGTVVTNDANAALWGYAPTTNNMLTADMLNPDAESEQDWNTILTQGVKGAAQGAIQAMVNNAQNSGQLVVGGARVNVQTNKGGQLLIFAAIAYFLLK